MSVKGEKRVRTNEMGAGKVYGEKDWEKEKIGRERQTKGRGSKERMGGNRDLEKGERRGR